MMNMAPPVPQFGKGFPQQGNNYGPVQGNPSVRKPQQFHSHPYQNNNTNGTFGNSRNSFGAKSNNSSGKSGGKGNSWKDKRIMAPKKPGYSGPGFVKGKG